jgi:hypothetical protein
MSTLLQTLLSIQAIIMSDDVYYNEPGYEGEAGTVEGDRKNEAYSNIGYLLFFKKVFIH